MLEGVRSLGLAALPWDDESRDFLARGEFVRRLGRSDRGRLARSLGRRARRGSRVARAVPRRASRAARSSTRVPLARGAARAARPRAAAATRRARADARRAADRLARAIDYLDDNAPWPRCACRRCSVSRPRRASAAAPCRSRSNCCRPAHRPLQVTRDLASFWRNAYVEVRKDMRGRYPRHYWPENPLEAEPTRRVKPRPTTR